ncbi:alpha-E domain-containing protein [Pseudomonas aeruginosa]|nr:alpha-E domain-containing protein [Pseudomonas aeruginosa]
MLSRTASDLYWMSRYLERAENLARMLDVSYSLSLLPQDRSGGGLDELAMPLLIPGTLDAYLERHGELAAERLLNFFALDPDNPASIYSCLAAARACAHAVRGRITLDMWENINATWLEMRGIATEGILRYGISRFCEWVKDRSHLFRGATFATSMRNDAFRFVRLGTFIERADNTLRLLDARYQTQDEPGDSVGAEEGTARGYYQWSALLRALSAFEGYTELYRASPNARNIAELLLLREDVPRSLLSCIEELSEILSGLPGVNGRPAQRLAAELQARVRYTGIDEVLEQGLHTWITDYILLVRQLANAIHRSYLEAA